MAQSSVSTFLLVMLIVLFRNGCPVTAFSGRTTAVRFRTVVQPRTFFSAAGERMTRSTAVAPPGLVKRRNADFCISPSRLCAVSSSSFATASSSSSSDTSGAEQIDLKALNPDANEGRRALSAICQLVDQNIQSTTPLSQLQQRLDDLEREQAEPGFWDDSNRAALVHSQVGTARRLVTRLQSWATWRDDATTALELWIDMGASEDDHDSDEADHWWHEFTQALQALQEDAHAYAQELLLAGPYDDAPARIILTAGAGGTEANDWVATLRRMYERHCSQSARGYQVRVEDEQPGDVVGYKTVELLVTGPQAYGWLQGEKGTHRLVRLSPFNANNKRQTTFAGVDVAPAIMEESQSLKSMNLPDSELEISTMRSGGKGGQNVNKVESAVRIKHLPTGLQVKCSQERSQPRNKEIALARLKSQLLALAEEQRLADYRQLRGDVVEASWGTQIRNYVLHPYKLIKDQRTGWETSDTQSFLDGDLDDCIGAYLRWKADQAQRAADEETKA